MNDWKFRRRQGQCGLCQRGFGEGEAYLSALSLSERDLSREDVCAACWRKQPVEALFWWRAKHSLVKKKRATLNLEAVEGLFRSLEEQPAPGSLESGSPGSPAQATLAEQPSLETGGAKVPSGASAQDLALQRELRYLLGLMLVRKRRYKLERISREDEREYMDLRRVRSKELTRVWVCDFPAERLAVLGERLRDLFEDSAPHAEASHGGSLEPAAIEG